MSRLNFTARARPADPGERDAAAFAGRAEPVADPPAPPPAAEAAPADAPPEPAPDIAPDASVIDRIGRLFGR
jgi:hypothetical protein